MLDRIDKRREQEKTARDERRLPPGQSLTNKFPVLHYGPVPYTELDSWDLRVFGQVEAEQRWNWDEFNKLPRVKTLMDIHCVTRWSKLDTTWEGVSLKTLIDEGFIRPLATAKFVIQHCEYGFTTSLPLEFMLADNIMLATHFDGEPISAEHGFPLRVVVGSFADRSEGQTAYFWKGGKWLRGLEFRADDQLGFWERNGYHNHADPWLEERFG